MRCLLSRWYVLLILAFALCIEAPRLAGAAGYQLDGQMAREITFSSGLYGADASTPLSSFRGHVVWIKFWLRDCPVCQAQMPEAQRMHERYNRAGLVVLTVMNHWQPNQVEPLMRRNGWNFRVGIDRHGRMGRRYGVGRRPTDYLVDIDGRIVASNRVSASQVERELRKYRAREYDGRVPRVANWSHVRDAAIRDDYGAALRLAESMKDATNPATAARQQLKILATEKVNHQAELARRGAARGRRARAVTDLRSLYTAYRGTSLEAYTKQIYDKFLASLSSGHKTRQPIRR